MTIDLHAVIITALWQPEKGLTADVDRGQTPYCEVETTVVAASPRS